MRREHIHVLGVPGAIRSLRDPAHLFGDLDAAVAHARSHVARSRQMLHDAGPRPAVPRRGHPGLRATGTCTTLALNRGKLINQKAGKTDRTG